VCVRPCEPLAISNVRAFKGPHRRPQRGFIHPPIVLLVLRQRRAASRRRTGLGTAIKNVRKCLRAKLRPSFQVFESTSPRGVPCLCADEAGNIFSFFGAHLPSVLLLLRQSRFAAGSLLGAGLGSSISKVRTCSTWGLHIYRVFFLLLRRRCVAASDWAK